MIFKTLIASSLAIFLAQDTPEARAQSELLGFSKSTVWPTVKEIDYESAKSSLVDWNTSTFDYYPKGTKVTYGFLEGVATDKILPVILPLNIGTIPKPWVGRVDDPRVPPFPRSGLYIAVDIDVGMIYLPRRDRKSDGTVPKRHDHGFDLGSGVSNPHGPNTDLMIPLPACVSKIDHRKIRLVTPDGTVHHPDDELWHPLGNQRGINGRGDLFDPTKPKDPVFYARPPVPTCSRLSSVDKKSTISFIMRFNTGKEIPMHFRLEMPDLEVYGKDIPLPPITFAPYDVINKKWIEK